MLKKEKKKRKSTQTKRWSSRNLHPNLWQPIQATSMTSRGSWPSTCGYLPPFALMYALLREKG